MGSGDRRQSQKMVQRKGQKKKKERAKKLAAERQARLAAADRGSEKKRVRRAPAGGAAAT